MGVAAFAVVVVVVVVVVAAAAVHLLYNKTRTYLLLRVSLVLELFVNRP